MMSLACRSSKRHQTCIRSKFSSESNENDHRYVAALCIPCRVDYFADHCHISQPILNLSSDSESSVIASRGTGPQDLIHCSCSSSRNRGCIRFQEPDDLPPSSFTLRAAAALARKARRASNESRSSHRQKSFRILLHILARVHAVSAACPPFRSLVSEIQAADDENRLSGSHLRIALAAIEDCMTDLFQVCGFFSRRYPD